MARRGEIAVVYLSGLVQGLQVTERTAVDMVQKANSGHPGLPLGSAAMAYALYHFNDAAKVTASLASTRSSTPRSPSPP